MPHTVGICHGELRIPLLNSVLVSIKFISNVLMPSGKGQQRHTPAMNYRAVEKYIQRFHQSGSISGYDFFHSGVNLFHRISFFRIEHQSMHQVKSTLSVMRKCYIVFQHFRVATERFDIQRLQQLIKNKPIDYSDPLQKEVSPDQDRLIKIEIALNSNTRSQRFDHCTSRRSRPTRLKITVCGFSFTPMNFCQLIIRSALLFLLFFSLLGSSLFSPLHFVLASHRLLGCECEHNFAQAGSMLGLHHRDRTDWVNGFSTPGKESCC